MKDEIKYFRYNFLNFDYFISYMNEKAL